MYDKSWYKSKTVWGFGLAALIALAQVFGVPVSDTATANIAQILSLFVGGYGMRAAMA